MIFLWLLACTGDGPGLPGDVTDTGPRGLPDLAERMPPSCYTPTCLGLSIRGEIAAEVERIAPVDGAVWAGGTVWGTLRVEGTDEVAGSGGRDLFLVRWRPGAGVEAAVVHESLGLVALEGAWVLVEPLVPEALATPELWKLGEDGAVLHAVPVPPDPTALASDGDGGVWLAGESVFGELGGEEVNGAWIAHVDASGVLGEVRELGTFRPVDLIAFDGGVAITGMYRNSGVFEGADLPSAEDNTGIFGILGGPVWPMIATTQTHVGRMALRPDGLLLVPLAFYPTLAMGELTLPDGTAYVRETGISPGVLAAFTGEGEFRGAVEVAVDAFSRMTVTAGPEDAMYVAATQLHVHDRGGPWLGTFGPTYPTDPLWVDLVSDGDRLFVAGTIQDTTAWGPHTFPGASNGASFLVALPVPE